MIQYMLPLLVVHFDAGKKNDPKTLEVLVKSSQEVFTSVIARIRKNLKKFLCNQKNATKELEENEFIKIFRSELTSPDPTPSTKSDA